jgi:hypothetical protein
MVFAALQAHASYLDQLPRRDEHAGERGEGVTLERSTFARAAA